MITVKSNMFDNPDTDTYYCRIIVVKISKKQRVRVRTKMKKGKWIYGYRIRDTFTKSECNTRMKYVPAHKDGEQFMANYIYCPKHNNKIVLGYWYDLWT